MKALIDFDVLVYQAGFASDAGAKRAGIEHETLSLCLSTLNHMIDGILYETQADSYVGYLTGAGNYREVVSVTRPYKGNRTGNKPHWYKEIKEYLVSHHGAIVVDGKEADDMLGIDQSGEDTIICTIDKDLDMIKGWHYNWNKGSPYFKTEEESIKFFYTQLLTGDTVDNIQGIKGVGAKKAEKLLDGLTGELELCCAVGKAYAEAYDNPEEVMIEMATLLWIMREDREDKIWQIPCY